MPSCSRLTERTVTLSFALRQGLPGVLQGWTGSRPLGRRSHRTARRGYSRRMSPSSTPPCRVRRGDVEDTTSPAPRSWGRLCGRCVPSVRKPDQPPCRWGMVLVTRRKAISQGRYGPRPASTTHLRGLHHWSMNDLARLMRAGARRRGLRGGVDRNRDPAVGGRRRHAERGRPAAAGRRPRCSRESAFEVSRIRS